MYDQGSVTIGSWSSGTLLNPVGRLSEAYTTSGGATQTAVIYSYDRMGRPASYWQCTPFNCGSGSYRAQYSYNLAGDIQSWVHPAPYLSFTNTTSPAQRVTQITASANVEQIPQNLAPSITYTPWGALSMVTDGCTGSGCTQVQETYDYNNRLQPVRIQLGTSANNSADYCLVYNYYAGVSNPTSCTNSPTQAATGNNGNVIGTWYQDQVNSAYNHTEAYGYDAVNRLTSAVATGNSTYNLSFDYTHDGSNGQYGNAHCTATQGVCNTTLQFSATTNRITTSGYTYDAAGNLTGDGTYTYQWDAEGRLSQALQGTTVLHTYTYNALGQRAEDLPASPYNPQEYVYDPFGQRLGDFFAYPSQPGWWHVTVPALGRIFVNTENWYVGAAWIYHYNALGSALATTNQAGTFEHDKLLYPWGQSWQGSGVGMWAGIYSLQCQLAPCFGASQTRDYNSNLGRWMSPDPLAGDVTNPQSLNRYAYALNNPVTFTDPSGLGDCGGDPTFDCNGPNPGKPPDPQGNWPGGGGTTIASGADTSNSDCSVFTTNGAQCAGYDGIWYGGMPGVSQHIYDPTASVSGIFGSLWPAGGGSGVWNEAVPPFSGGGFGLPCDFGTCGPGVPGGNGFGPAAGVAIAVGAGVCGATGICETVGAAVLVGAAIGLAAAKIQNIYQKGSEQRTIREIASRTGVDRRALGRAVEVYKQDHGMPNDATLSYAEIWAIAQDVKAGVYKGAR